MEEMEARLSDARVSPSRLDAIALTHGHLDHSRAAGRLAKKSGATVICCERLMRNHALRKAPRLRTLPVGIPIDVEAARGTDRATILAVQVPHDADPTVAFRVEHKGRIACLITDLGSHTPALKRYLSDAHVCVLEFNHDEERLSKGTYPDPLKKRIRGSHGHLSNAQAAHCLGDLINSNLHTLVLAHLSHENNTKELAHAAASEVLARAGRPDVRVLIAEQKVIGANLAV